MRKPPCFDSHEQLVTWRHLNYIAHGGAEVKGEKATSGYCLDCTPEYAQKMRSIGNCVQPQVVFNRTAEGEMVGVGFQKWEDE